MGDCSVGDFLLIFLLLSIPHNGLSANGDSDNEVTIHRTVEYLQLYSKPTGNQGDTLIIGSKSDYESVEHIFPGFDHESCGPMRSVDYDVSKYGTKISNRSNSNHFDVPVGEQLQEVKATDYFIHFGVQALNCELKKDGTGKLGRYMKIVNSMSSIEDNIREIKYYSGVSVSIEECGGRKCIQVKETKCMTKLGGQRLGQFKCDYATERPASPPIIVPNMTVEHFKREHLETSLGYQYKRENVVTVTISEEGKSFRIGINENPSGIVPTPSTPPEQRNALAVACQPPIINPTIFHPECYQKVRNEEDESLKDVLLNDEQFRESFTVVDQTVQICKEMNGSAPDSSPHARVFYRVQMTVIGKTKVNQITLGTGITELYSINLAGGAVTVRYTDMRFYDAITRTSVDELYYRNMFPSDMKVFITSNSAPVAHTPSDARATPGSLDVDYKLRPERIYSTFISSDGYNFLVGSKPKLDIDIGTASCKRVDYTGDHFKTELKIVAEEDEDIHAHLTANIYRYYRLIQQQSWRCEYNKENENHKFIRVVNHLEFLVPVHTLESYDGVEILRRPSAEEYILEIFELKYLLGNPDKPEEHLTPMRATGKISFATDDRPTDTDTAYAMGRGFNAISKSEVHPRFISQIPKRAHNRNDYYRAGSIKDYKTLKIDEEGHQQREMIFTTKLMEQDGKKGVNKPFTGLFVCKPGSLPYWMETMRPYFEIFQDGRSLVNNSMENNDNFEKTEEYLDNIVQKWTCIKTGDTTAEEFLRIITKGDVIAKSDAHALNAIQFTPVDDVSLKLLESTGSSQNSKYKITYEGVRYYRHEDLASEGNKRVFRIINFDFGGYLILETTNPDDFGTTPYRNWRSGTMNIMNAPSTSKDPQYGVDETTQVYYSDGDRVREYSFHLPGDQSSKEWEGKRMMRIGESYRVEKKIKLNSEVLRCHENLEIAKTANSDNRLQTLVQTFKYSSKGNAAELEQSYHGRKTRVWECTSAPRQIKILRVMNNFLFNQTEVENIRTILYSDGIAIFSGKKNNEGMLEIAEVKFLNAEDYTNLKLEGAIEFDQSSGNLNLHPTELSETKIQDVNYILNDNELFRVHPFTYPAQPGQSPNIIYTLEIREPHPGMKSDEDKEGTRFQTLIRCNELKRSLPKEVRNDVMRPKVIILQSKGVERKVLPHTITKLKNYFDDIKQKIWECKVLPQGTATLYRVQTRMKSKQDEKIREIFYQNGVKIHEDYNDRRHLIEITSYFEKTSKNGKPAFIPVKFEGLVILPFDDLKNKFMDYEGNFHNHLDEPIFQFSPLSKETGVSYLVQSEFTTTIDNSAGEIIVTCVKYSDENTKPRTMQPRILVKKINRNDHENGKWHEVDRKTNNDGILYESYEMWSCYYKKYHFLRVVNKMIMEDNVRVYYQDGVEVQRLILLNGQKFIQIKHERFLKETKEYVHKIKYIGRLQLEIQTLPGLEKMLSSPPFNIQVLGKEDEQQSPSPYQTSYIFTLDSMRYAAFREIGVRSDGLNQSPPIEFSSQRDFLQTTFFTAKSSRIFQLGRFWNELLSDAKTIKCYVYTTANLRAMGYRTYPEDDKTKYNPRVAEYIDQKLYILTQDEFDEIFTITSVRTWFCTDNTNEFIKVETNFETTTIPFAVRSADGVKVELEKLENEELLKIRETVYINMMNSKIYKRSQNKPIGKKKPEDLLEFFIQAEIKRSTKKGCLGC